MGLLDDRVAFVTGAARGMGRNHALRLAREGASIIGVDVAAEVSPHNGYPAATEADLKETARLVEAEGRPCVMEIADVRNSDALEAVLAAGASASVDAWTSLSPTRGSATGRASGRCRTSSGRR